MGAGQTKQEFLPLTPEEVEARGWDAVDVVLVTGDAYVDHPSFAMAVIGRVLEAEGHRVAILSQPGWRRADDFRRFGKPRLFFGISAGNMDSMVNKYTALGKVRREDAYSEGAVPDRRPDRAAIVYAQRAREAYGDVPIVLGGIEASLRRFAHYDFWSAAVRRSIVLDAKADLLVWGMGERQAVEIARRLSAGESVSSIRDVRGTVFALREGEAPPAGAVDLPSHEDVASNADAFNRATRIIHNEVNPYNAGPLAQAHGRRIVVQMPPPLPLTEEELDSVYSLPYTRKPHPSYTGPVPAFETVKSSITIMRGCFGGCSFCSIALHQGRIVQSRSEGSVLRELELLACSGDFKGTVTDLGGPTSNMYGMGCSDRRALERCRRLSCLYPTICPLLRAGHGAVLSLMRKARRTEGVRHVFVGSGVRMDLAVREPEYVRELAFHHTSGHLKVAPEHVSKKVLRIMKKPGPEVFDRFRSLFARFSREAGKRQYLVPYLIASHPGAGLEDELELALYLKDNGFKPRQVQDFLPSPMDVSTAIYHTGKHPFTGEEVEVCRGERAKRLHRALIQSFSERNRSIILRSLDAPGLSERKDEVLALVGRTREHAKGGSTRSKERKEKARGGGRADEPAATEPRGRRRGRKGRRRS